MKFKFLRVGFASLFLAGLLVISSFCQLDTLAAPVTETISQAQIDRLGTYDVIYLGENHDLAAHHAAQLKIITRLNQNTAKTDTQLVLGWEMFQRPFQPILDRYLAGKISEAELRTQAEYDRRWGFDWEFYAPILRYARQKQIPLIALNTPEEITHKVATTGIDSLEGNDWRYLPPLTEIDLDNREYRQKMADIYQAHVAAGQGNSSDRDNFFAAQVLWDETMAEAIAKYYQSDSNSQIVVLVGKAHVMDDYAIPERVARRIEDRSFSQATYLLAEN